MTTKRIIYNDENGQCVVVAPAAEAMRDRFAMVKNKKGEPIKYIIKKGLTIDEIAEKDTPNNVEYKIIDVSDLPSEDGKEDLYFMEAWEADIETGKISVNIEKAKHVHIDKIRQDRNSKWPDFDKRYMEAERNGEDLTELKKERNKLKSIIGDVIEDISNCNCHKELKGIMPTF